MICSLGKKIFHEQAFFYMANLQYKCNTYKK